MTSGRYPAKAAKGRLSVAAVLAVMTTSSCDQCWRYDNNRPPMPECLSPTRVEGKGVVDGVPFAVRIPSCLHRGSSERVAIWLPRSVGAGLYYGPVIKVRRQYAPRQLLSESFDADRREKREFIKLWRTYGRQRGEQRDSASRTGAEKGYWKSTHYIRSSDNVRALKCTSEYSADDTFRYHGEMRTMLEGICRGIALRGGGPK